VKLTALPLAALVLLGACSSNPPEVLPPEDPATPPPSLQDASHVYRVGPSDVLRVNVFGHEELSSAPYGGLATGGPGTPVDGGGAIMLPLVGSVQVGGLTVHEVAQEVETALATYLREPRVDVAVVRFGAQRAFVLGEVAEPGAIVLERPTTALEALALAGGFGTYAHREQVAWIRGPIAEENLVLLDATRIDPRGAEPLQPGDLLFVGRRSWSDAAEAARELVPLLSFVTQPLSLAIQAATLEKVD
jgi:polysaccharide export outer membrane protein